MHAAARAVLVLSLPLPLLAQTWNRAEVSPSSRSVSTTAYDRARDRIVMYGHPDGDNITWEWDGRTWSPRYTDPYPVVVRRHGIVYDDRQRATWLFDFWSRQTWTYDGREWTRTAATVAPPQREYPEIVYDRQRGVVVLFGGADHHTVYGDTWEWDGSVWTQRNPPVVPPARSGHAMVYDPVAGHVLMFGGSSGTSLLDDTWAWDGTFWVQQQAVVRPTPRYGSHLAFDPVRQRPLLFGGYGPQRNADTWEWNGTNWQQLQPANSPPTLSGTAMETHEGSNRVVLYTGRQTWEWDGNDWTLQHGFPAPPLSRPAAAADRTRNRIVVFGDTVGNSSTGTPTGTWEWDGQRWHDLQPAVEPPPRGFPAMAHDRVRGVTVLHGGTTSFGGPRSDTWEWNGSQWVQRFPATVPQTSQRTAMYHDPSMGMNVLCAQGDFVTLNGFFQWAWDGNDWQQITARTDLGPFMAAAYDEARGVPVVVTGLGTYEQVGGQWQQRAAPGPFIGNLNGRGLEYDPLRQKVVAVSWTAGLKAYSVPAWEWDGNAWSALPAAECYGLYGPRLLVEDPSRSRLALIGGNVEATRFWNLTATPARGEDFGSGCGGTAGEVTLTPRGKPRTGNDTFGIDIDHALPNALVLLGISVGEGNVPLGNGCSWYFGSPIVSHFLIANSAGFRAIDLPVPLANTLRGLPLAAQAFAVDPGGPHLGSFSVSAGLRIVVGD